MSILLTVVSRDASGVVSSMLKHLISTFHGEDRLHCRTIWKLVDPAQPWNDITLQIGNVRPAACRFCEDYEAAIRAAGGIDVQLLGMGRMGHIGFNESGYLPYLPTCPPSDLLCITSSSPCGYQR